MPRNSLLRAVCLSGCFAAASGYGQQQHVSAHVLDVTGAWLLEGRASPLAVGDGLSPGAKITAVDDHQDHAITLVQDEDLSRRRIVCDSSASNPCRNPIILPGLVSDASAPGQLRGLMQAALALLLDRPPAVANHYALTLTRGQESIRESEAVIVLDPGTGVTLPPPPEDMPAGKYTLSIAKNGNKSTAIEQHAMLTSAGSWRPLPFRETGLFEVSIANADGDQIADIMLLVVPPDQYLSTRAGFDAMKERTAAWSGPSARDDEHLFLRAFLLSETSPS